MSEMCDVEERRGPLVISAPHVGTVLPDDIAARLTPAGRELVDTDWYADRLYPFADVLDATIVRAHYSRYVVDLNRDPSGASLYPGARTTGIVPSETFAGEPLYRDAVPDAREIAARTARYFAPYHDELARQLDRVVQRNGRALLVDAHSIWGRLPLLFDGELPDVNLGTNGGRACDPALVEAARRAVAASPYSVVVDGRFKGGYITRHYGAAQERVQALQIEINQRTYLAEGSRTHWDAPKAAQLSLVLRRACEDALACLEIAGAA